MIEDRSRVGDMIKEVKRKHLICRQGHCLLDMLDLDIMLGIEESILEDTMTSDVSATQEEKGISRIQSTLI